MQGGEGFIREHHIKGHYIGPRVYQVLNNGWPNRAIPRPTPKTFDGAIIASANSHFGLRIETTPMNEFKV